MPRIDLLIFDCDGVLLDSERISCECAADAFQSIGMQIDIETVFRRFVGVSRHKMAERVAAEGYPVGPDFVEKLEQSITDAFEQRLQSVPGVQEALYQVALPRCVASSSPVPYIRRGLALTGLSHFFEPHLFSASMVAHPKPAPDLFLYAAAQMNAEPRHCLVIEDSTSGVQAANAAGMPVFWFLGGSHIDLEKRPPDFAAAHADMTVSSMLDLPAAINAFSRRHSS